MRYPDMKEYITFLFSLLDEFAETKKIVISKERPKPVQMLRYSSFMR